jgi:hypothetical protein
MAKMRRKAKTTRAQAAKQLKVRLKRRLDKVLAELPPEKDVEQAAAANECANKCVTEATYRHSEVQQMLVNDRVGAFLTRLGALHRVKTDCMLITLQDARSIATALGAHGY